MSIYSGEVPTWVWACIIVILAIALFYLFRNKFLSLFEKEHTYANNRNLNTGTNRGHIGDNYYGCTPSMTEHERNVLMGCITVLEKAKTQNGHIGRDELEALCGETADDVYDLISSEKVFHEWKGQRKIGLGKMNPDNIDKLVRKYRRQLSNN